MSRAYCRIFITSLVALIAILIAPLFCCAYAQVSSTKPSVYTQLPDAPDPIASSLRGALSIHTSSYFSSVLLHSETTHSIESMSPPVAPQTYQDRIYNPSDSSSSGQANADKIGSANVPMDSWVYPALERLANLGLIPTQSIAIRPWTRQECLRQITEATELAERNGISPSVRIEAERLLADLHNELDNEAYADKSASVESVYIRPGTIVGPALSDSYHFGQTWWNDFGRPLGRGSSFITGTSARATQGRFFLYAREEFQHGPGNAAYSSSVNELISTLDTVPGDGDPTIQPFLGFSSINRGRPVELYNGIAGAGNALTFGKQELFWGPTTMGPLAFSSNADPTYNLRYVSTRPHPLPFFPSLGTYRFDIVVGKLSGHKYPARPYYNGQKVDFNFGSNLEFSFTRWAVFLGEGHPMTFDNLRRDIFSFDSTGSYVGRGFAPYGDPKDPGDRKSNFDFRYRPPYFGKFITLYADAYSDDDPNPIDAPRRAFWSPGIYLARLPWLPHIDLRVEAASSEGLARDFGGQHFLFNGQYLDSNTNKDFLLGNAVGRDGRAIEARSSYWLSARTRVEAGYRQNKGSNLFLPGGSTITDGFLNASYEINRYFQAQLFTQYENFCIPSYLTDTRHNISGWIQITWYPQASLPMHK
jgi:hypothetical protein